MIVPFFNTLTEPKTFQCPSCLLFMYVHQDAIETQALYTGDVIEGYIGDVILLYCTYIDVMNFIVTSTKAKLHIQYNNIIHYIFIYFF